jgi:hypothetical protein
MLLCFLLQLREPEIDYICYHPDTSNNSYSHICSVLKNVWPQVQDEHGVGPVFGISDVSDNTGVDSILEKCKSSLLLIDMEDVETPFILNLSMLPDNSKREVFIGYDFLGLHSFGSGLLLEKPAVRMEILKTRIDALRKVGAGHPAGIKGFIRGMSTVSEVLNINSSWPSPTVHLISETERGKQLNLTEKVKLLAFIEQIIRLDGDYIVPMVSLTGSAFSDSVGEQGRIQTDLLVYGPSLTYPSYHGPIDPRNVYVFEYTPFMRHCHIRFGQSNSVDYDTTGITDGYWPQEFVTVDRDWYAETFKYVLLDDENWLHFHLDIHNEPGFNHTGITISIDDFKSVFPQADTSSYYDHRDPHYNAIGDMPKTLHVIFEWNWSRWDESGVIPLTLEVPWAWNILFETQKPECVELSIVEREKDPPLTHPWLTPIAIAGIVVGCVVGVTLIALVVYLVWARRKNAEREEAERLTRASTEENETLMGNDYSQTGTDYDDFHNSDKGEEHLEHQGGGK